MSNIYYITPEMFQAAGDGITDDSSAIQNALNSLKLNSNDNIFATLVFASNKDYLLNTPIEIPYGVNVNFNDSTVIVGDPITDFCIYVNANASDKSTQVPYPSKLQVIENLKLVTQKDRRTGIYNREKNGIYMAGRGILRNIYSYYVNKVIYCTDDYIDDIQLEDIHCMSRAGDDYAIYMGYLGDNRVATNIMQNGYSNIMLPNYVGEDRALTLDTGSAHRHIEIKRLINGNVRVRSNAVLSNIMLSSTGTLYIERCSATITNFYSQYMGKPTVVIDSYRENSTQESNQPAHVTIDQGEFLIGNVSGHEYIKDEDGTYVEGACIDIDKIGNGSLELNNVFIVYQGPIVQDRVLCPITLSNGTAIAKSLSEYYHLKSSYETHIRISRVSLNTIEIRPDNESSLFGASYYAAIPNYKFWHGPGGTFYYKICYVIDPKENLLVYGNSEISVTTGQNYSIVIRTNIHYGLIRVYRGETSRMYTKYVDIPMLHKNYLIDDNVRINGRLWKEVDHQIPQSGNAPAFYKIVPTAITSNGLSYIVTTENLEDSQ